MVRCGGCKSGKPVNINNNNSEASPASQQGVIKIPVGTGVGVRCLSVPPKDPNGVRLAAQMKRRVVMAGWMAGERGQVSAENETLSCTKIHDGDPVF